MLNKYLWADESWTPETGVKVLVGGERPSRKRRKVEGYFIHNLLPFGPPWFCLEEMKVKDEMEIHL